MGWEIKQTNLPEIQGKLFTNLLDEEKMLINILKSKGDCFIDDLAFESNLPSSVVSSLLLNLEFSGFIKSLPGKVFRLQ